MPRAYSNAMIHLAGRLKDLKGKRHVHDRAGRRGGNPFVSGSAVRPVGEVLLLFRQCPRLIWDLAADHDALTGRHAEPRGMVLNVPGRCVQDLPHALQVGLAVGCAWKVSDLGGRRKRGEHQGSGGNRAGKSVSHLTSLRKARRRPVANCFYIEPMGVGNTLIIPAVPGVPRVS